MGCTAARTAEFLRSDALQRDIELAGQRIDQLERNRQLVVDQLAALSPDAVLRVLAALGAVVVAGIAFPVIVLSFRWPDLTVPWRISLVGAFLASVAGLGAYIYRVARRYE